MALPKLISTDWDFSHDSQKNKPSRDTVDCVKLDATLETIKSRLNSIVAIIHTLWDDDEHSDFAQNQDIKFYYIFEQIFNDFINQYNNTDGHIAKIEEIIDTLKTQIENLQEQIKENQEIDLIPVTLNEFTQNFINADGEVTHELQKGDFKNKGIVRLAEKDTGTNDTDAVSVRMYRALVADIKTTIGDISDAVDKTKLAVSDANDSSKRAVGELSGTGKKYEGPDIAWGFDRCALWCFMDLSKSHELTWQVPKGVDRFYISVHRLYGYNAASDDKEFRYGFIKEPSAFRRKARIRVMVDDLTGDKTTLKLNLTRSQKKSGKNIEITYKFSGNLLPIYFEEETKLVGITATQNALTRSLNEVGSLVATASTKDRYNSTVNINSMSRAKIIKKGLVGEWSELAPLYNKHLRNTREHNHNLVFIEWDNP